MRYLRIFTVILFLLSLLVFWWGNSRYYKNLDTVYPVLRSSEEVLELSVTDSDEELFRGLSASDPVDGDLTEQIMLASISHFLEPGTVNVKYVVFDSNNNAATLTRKVHYTDYKSPVFSLEKSPVYKVGSSFDLLDYIHVNDCLDGDITDQVRVISNMVNNYAVGRYPVILEVSNSCGDTATITLWINYTSEENTAIIKLHSYIVYIQQGETFVPERWIASVTDRDTLPLDAEKIEIQGNLDVNTPGDYQLIYNYEDGNLSGQAAITVVVAERQA